MVSCCYEEWEFETCQAEVKSGFNWYFIDVSALLRRPPLQLPLPKAKPLYSNFSLEIFCASEFHWRRLVSIPGGFFCPKEAKKGMEIEPQIKSLLGSFDLFCWPSLWSHIHYTFLIHLFSLAFENGRIKIQHWFVHHRWDLSPVKSSEKKWLACCSFLLGLTNEGVIFKTRITAQ